VTDRPRRPCECGQGDGQPRPEASSEAQPDGVRGLSRLRAGLLGLPSIGTGAALAGGGVAAGGGIANLPAWAVLSLFILTTLICLTQTVFPQHSADRVKWWVNRRDHQRQLRASQKAQVHGRITANARNYRRSSSSQQPIRRRRRRDRDRTRRHNH